MNNTTNASSAVLSADRYDAPKAKEYQELLDMIEGRGKNGKDVYGNLMSTEERVLDTVDRVVNDARLQTTNQDSFLHMSLFDNAAATARTLHDTFLDLSRVRSARDVQLAFIKKDRLLYLGVVLVLVAVTLIVLDLAA